MADRQRTRVRQQRITAAACVLAVAGIITMACEPMEPAQVVRPTPTPAPPPPETEKSWTLRAEHFGDDGGAIWAETTNRSEPFAWDRITAANADAVSVSIGGKDLGEDRSLTSTAYEPAFPSDLSLSGAEWTVIAEVGTGAVVLVLTAPNQRGASVASVTVTEGGSGYATAPRVWITGCGGSGAAATATRSSSFGVASVTITTAGSYTGTPDVTFSAPQEADGATATGTAVRAQPLPGASAISAVNVTDPGSGYTSAPSVTFSGGGETTPAVAEATLATTTSVASVTLTRGGRGFRCVPKVRFTGGGGSGAAATATLGPKRGNDEFQNLYFGRQTLYGKELLIQLAEADAE